MSYSRYFFWLVILLSVKAALLIGFLSLKYIGLGPDEAQYWTWSQYLDWGYYSKPPGIAWQIAFTTYFLGNTELGVRFGAILIGTTLPLLIFILAKSCHLKSKTAFWSGVTMAFIPLGFMASILSITDGGLVLFWTIGCVVMTKALTQQKSPNFYLLGFIIMGGALFKWPIYFFWLVVVGLAFFVPQFRSKQLLGGLAVSLLGLLPSLIWNYHHDWVTFKHVAGNIVGTSSNGHNSNVVNFIGEQAVLLSPLLFFLLILAYLDLIRHFREIPIGIKFCGMTSLVFLLGYSMAASFQKIQGNWCDFIYPPAIVFLCNYIFERKSNKEKFFNWGLGVSCLLILITFSLPLIQSQGWLFYPIPYKINPFRHNLGWQQLSKTLKQVGYEEKKDFLIGDKYQTSSILSFYSPGQKLAYFLNLNQNRLNQFSFWPSLGEAVEHTGFFVLVENSPHWEKNFPLFQTEYLHKLQNYFEEVIFLGTFPLFYNNSQPVKVALIFKCQGYNGKEPSKPNLY